ncbi:hypothetical protein FQA39_LY03403 [Lamprigera yunnana]|nr:hypothetical protein FQA39_LY03403 [Lamprigera yunnana]
MDVFLLIVLFIVFCVLFSICGWCCKKHREGTIYGVPSATVTVTSQPVNQSIPSYPVDQRHQQQVIPPPGFAPSGYQAGPYPVPPMTPYPPAPGGYPPATPYQAPYPPGNITPYPPAVSNYSVHQLPPSYTEAVNQPTAEPRPPVNEGYSKQAPYNPNY